MEEVVLVVLGAVLRYVGHALADKRSPRRTTRLEILHHRPASPGRSHRTLPKYIENGLVSDRDSAVAFGPVFRDGTFSWANGSRLYYANLISNFPGQQAFKAFEAIGVSRLPRLPPRRAYRSLSTRSRKSP